MRHDGLEQAGAHVEARADEHAAGGAADEGDVAGRRELLVGELVGDGDEVGEGALLREELGGLVPRLAQVAAAADVRRRHDEAEVGVERVRVAPDGLLGDAVRAVPLEQQRHRAVALEERLLVEHRHRHAHVGLRVLGLGRAVQRLVQRQRLVLGVPRVQPLRVVLLAHVVGHLLLLAHGHHRRAAAAAVAVAARRVPVPVVPGGRLRRSV